MPHNVEIRKLRSIMENMSLALRQERCIDVIVNFLNSLTTIFNFTKASVYAINPLMQ